MDICKLLFCAIDYAYFKGRILHENAAEFNFRSANPLKLGAIIFYYFNMFCLIGILNSIISRF